MRILDAPTTTPFDEMRPLALSIEKRTHIHGAIDIGALTGTIIKAPETGQAMIWVAYRFYEGQYWPNDVKVHDEVFPFSNYFYDMYGAIIVFRSKKYTHIMAHSYTNQLFNDCFYTKKTFYEEKANTRFPIHAVYSRWIDVGEGSFIGTVGNAGFSTGPHVHWEIHHGYQWEKWEDRVNPEEVL